MTKGQAHNRTQWKHYLCPLETVSSVFGVRRTSTYRSNSFYHPPVVANNCFPHFLLIFKLLGKRVYTPRHKPVGCKSKKCVSLGLSFIFNNSELVVKHFKNWVCTNKIQIKTQIQASLEKLENLPSLSAFLFSNSWPYLSPCSKFSPIYHCPFPLNVYSWPALHNSVSWLAGSHWVLQSQNAPQQGRVRRYCTRSSHTKPPRQLGMSWGEKPILVQGTPLGTWKPHLFSSLPLEERASEGSLR